MDVLTVKELAIYLGCSESTIRKLIRTQQIPFFKLSRKINFDKQVIDKWIQEQYLNNANNNKGADIK